MVQQLYRSTKRLSRDITQEFDGEGLRDVLYAALSTVYKQAPHVTLPQLLVAAAVLIAERNGRPHTLATLVEQLDMPYSTASRVVWSLTEEGGDHRVLKYVRHPHDGRKKLLVMDPRYLNRTVPKAMMQAMIDYYGDSVTRLKRAD